MTAQPLHVLDRRRTFDVEIPCDIAPLSGRNAAAAPRFVREATGTSSESPASTVVAHAQEVNGAPARDALGPDEAAFVAARDSFYLASVNPEGWPYLQHRGGPAGFLTVLDAHTLGFADLKGNRQLLTTGHLRANDRVALFLMDYPGRRRLKLVGRARTIDADDDPSLAERLSPPDLQKKVERLVVIDVLGFDWNCPAYITPRYTAAEVEEVMAPLRARIAQLERERLSGEHAPRSP